MANKRRTSRLQRSIATLLALIALVTGVVLFEGAPTVQQSSPPPITNSQSGTAHQVLATLSVKGRAPRTGYSREAFGGSWAIVANCDVRNKILQRDLKDVVLDEQKCKVQSGTLHDPYTAKVIPFVRGPTTSDDVQIDHVVAVSDAWQKGAQQLTFERRVDFYNDSLNLLAVDGPTNEKKADSDAASWLPPNKAYRCQYVARQIAVKAAYTLWVTQAEHDAMARVLQTCPDQQLPMITT
jgi:hypothetical protein